MSNSTSGLMTNGVTITQVHANAGSTSDQVYGSLDIDGDGVYSNSDEFIEISNFSTEPVDVSGWQIWTSNDGGGADGKLYHTFPPGTFLQPGESFYVITEYSGTPPAGVIEANGVSNASDTTNFLPDVNGGEIALVNTTDPANVEYVQFTMDMTPDDVTSYAGFPQNTDGTDATRVTGDPLPETVSSDVLQGYIMGAQRTYGINETPQNGLSVTYDPFKGEVGYINGGADFPGLTPVSQAQVDLNGITFYEVLPDNNSGLNGFDVDGDGNATNADQFVSFVNVTDAPIDISGYEVWSTTQAGGDTTVFKYHTFPPGTVLQPGQAVYVVTEYSGDLSERDEFIFEANGAVTDDDSQLLRANSLGELALVEGGDGTLIGEASRDYIQLSFDPTPADLSAQDDFPGANLTGDIIQARAEYLDGTNPTNSDTYRYDWETGLVSEIPQFVSLAVCFTTGTLIKTREGEIAIENIVPGMEVLTLDNGYQPVRWIGSRQVTAWELAAQPNLRPIRIRAGALGQNQPEKDLVVSPQHRVFVQSKIAERVFGEAEALVAAKHLLAIDGVDIADDLADVTYWHFLFEAHQIVLANGAATESLYTGPQALKAVSPEAREEILAIFPELVEDPQVKLPPARPLVRGRLARKFAKRSAKNWKAVVSNIPTVKLVQFQGDLRA